MPDLSDQFNIELEKINYEKSSSLFKSIAIVLGVLGIIVAIIMFIVGVFGGGFGAIVAAFGLAIQSIILIVIGDMMYGLSRVTLATMEAVKGIEQMKNQSTDFEN